VLTYNGEVYNTASSGTGSPRAGRRFCSDSDTEIILHLAEVHGVDGFAQLEGMFAFGLWDRERRELVLVRDRLGIKPLFWLETPDGTGVRLRAEGASRARAGLTLGAERVAEYLAFRLLASEEAMEPPLRTLLPGQRLIASAQHPCRAVWRPDRAAPPDPATPSRS